MASGESRTEFIYPEPDVVIENNVPVRAIVSIEWTAIIDLRKKNIVVKNLYKQKVVMNSGYNSIPIDKNKIEDDSQILEVYEDFDETNCSFFDERENAIADCKLMKIEENSYIILSF